jgi:hypothetical protein
VVFATPASSPTPTYQCHQSQPDRIGIFRPLQLAGLTFNLQVNFRLLKISMYIGTPLTWRCETLRCPA